MSYNSSQNAPISSYLFYKDPTKISLVCDSIGYSVRFNPSTDGLSMEVSVMNLNSLDVFLDVIEGNQNLFEDIIQNFRKGLENSTSLLVWKDEEIKLSFQCPKNGGSTSHLTEIVCLKKKSIANYSKLAYSLIRITKQTTSLKNKILNNILESEFTVDEHCQNLNTLKNYVTSRNNMICASVQSKADALETRSDEVSALLKENQTIANRNNI